MKHILQNIGDIAALETVPVLKALGRANRALGEVKGAALSLPNRTILIDTIALQEALASSEIENIVTTRDEVFQVGLEISRLTARSYLKKLAAAGFVSERRAGRDNYYVTDRLVSLLAEVSS